MFIKLKRDELNKCLETVEKALPSHSTIPVIENILFESDGTNLIFTSTNLELEIRVKLPCSSGETGKVLLPQKTVDIVHYLPAQDVDMNFNWEGFRCDIDSGPSKFSLFGADAADYPVVEEMTPEDGELSLEQMFLKQVLKTVVFAASNDESRPAFNGILFVFKKQGITLISSDTFRLVVKVITNEAWDFEEKRYLIPAKSLRELLKILSEENKYIHIFPRQKKVVFNMGQVYFSTRVLNEKYPDVSGVIPAKFNTRIIVERKQLEDTVGRAALLTEGMNQAIQLSIAGNRLEVKVSSPVGKMEEFLLARQEGEDLDIFINSRFVMDILKVVEAKEILIDFHGKNGPVIFRFLEDESYLYLVLPIKMD